MSDTSCQSCLIPPEVICLIIPKVKSSNLFWYRKYWKSYINSTEVISHTSLEHLESNLVKENHFGLHPLHLIFELLLPTLGGSSVSDINWFGSVIWFRSICLRFFWLRILNILTHTHGKRGEGLKETDSNVYPKRPNSWIHSTDLEY